MRRLDCVLNPSFGSNAGQMCSRRHCCSGVLNHVAQLGAEPQIEAIHARADLRAPPEAEPFFLANGFVRGNRLWTVEAEKEPLYSYLDRLVQQSDRSLTEPSAGRGRTACVGSAVCRITRTGWR